MGNQPDELCIHSAGTRASKKTTCKGAGYNAASIVSRVSASGRRPGATAGSAPGRRRAAPVQVALAIERWASSAVPVEAPAAASRRRTATARGAQGTARRRSRRRERATVTVRRRVAFAPVPQSVPAGTAGRGRTTAPVTASSTPNRGGKWCCSLAPFWRRRAVGGHGSRRWLARLGEMQSDGE